jgi:ABC-type transporter Mla subunit MlaD
VTAPLAAWLRHLIALPRRVAEIRTDMKGLLAMADQITTTLTEVADGLRGPLATSITALLAERDQLAARNAELEGTEATQSAAADDVRAAFADVAAKFAPVAEVPDVPELPESDQPAADTF